MTPSRLLYLLFGLAVVGGAAYADVRGWTPFPPRAQLVGPRSVRQNPGAYRPIYRSSARYRLGK